MLVCVFFSHFAHGTAGAARIRHSLRPRFRGERMMHNSGAVRAARTSCVDALPDLRQARPKEDSGGRPMLRAEDNQFLTESGAGTPMGELLRRFWLPVLLSEELPEADGPPKKIVVMGEELLAFRDSRGVVGVIDQHCPHRGANLWLGRNEECGIRCVYHGWKFDTDGPCVDMPTSYPDLDAKNLIRIKSYPVREWGDMIWAYMGPAGEIPDLPALEMALLPASHRYVSQEWQGCKRGRG